MTELLNYPYRQRRARLEALRPRGDLLDARPRAPPTTTGTRPPCPTGTYAAGQNRDLEAGGVMSLTWLETEGGPFIVVPHAALSHWSGTEGDYDRACEVMDLVGVLELPGGAEALVLGDEPLSTTYLPEHRVLVRWCYAESEEGVADIILARLPTAEWDAGPVLSTTGKLVMFDAAYFGTEAGTLTDCTVLGLGAGRYRVDSASIEPDHLTSFRVHRFVELT
ncbi:Imm21 family immunity protein [Streptomyces sp. NPDC048258]|uniref:Imm21 family immunity protein n=1 Tax=Streptomyces sp. NPDC048258 TaxID=3365527 RepID=UPI00371748CA